MSAGNLWDIFCRVIDNYGDIGVCWRLSADLAARGQRVRLWVDDASALRWMAPQGAPGVEVRTWTQPIQTEDLITGNILVEAFACEIPSEYLAAYTSKIKSTGQSSAWINLEYLSAEGFAERNHGLPSPVLSGPGSGLRKHFFYPGFSPATGGLLREPDLLTRQVRFDRAVWLQQQNIAFAGERLVSLFCYEPAALGDLLDHLATDSQSTRLLVTSGRAAAAVRRCIEGKNRSRPAWNECAALSISFLPALSQRDFDHLLWTCDLNFVRGEDSLVRALWANKPFIWQIYAQHDDAHHDKLDAFLDVISAPLSLRTFHQVWNGVKDEYGTAQTTLPALDLPEWQQCATQARRQQLQQDDLVTRLIRFVSKNP